MYTTRPRFYMKHIDTQKCNCYHWLYAESYVLSTYNILVISIVIRTVEVITSEKCWAGFIEMEMLIVNESDVKQSQILTSHDPFFVKTDNKHKNIQQTYIYDEMYRTPRQEPPKPNIIQMHCNKNHHS